MKAERSLSGAEVGELMLLAALWGGSFLFMRTAVPAFGPFALAGMRVIGASLVLLPLLAARGEVGALRRHWKPIFIVGITNSALPFVCFTYAALSLTAGLSAIFNAASPLFAAVIAWLWLKDAPGPSRVAGLGIGFAGVFGLAWASASVKVGADETRAAWAVAACVVGTVSYGYSANYTRRYLAKALPLAVAAGSQLGATLVLLPMTLLMWPEVPPDDHAWMQAGLLAVFCTGLAYVLFFRLIAQAGPANAISVTFLVPAFAVAWGALFLGEQPGARTLAGCAVILLGTALATGVLQRWLAPRSAGA